MHCKNFILYLGTQIRLMAVISSVLLCFFLFPGIAQSQSDAVAGLKWEESTKGLTDTLSAHKSGGSLPKMVFIQMYVFEVTLENEKDMGFVHRLQNQDGGTVGAEIGRLRSPTNMDLGVISAVGEGESPGFSLVGVTIDEDHGRITSELQAFAQKRNTTVFASPFIMTLDGQPAAISTGDEVPYLKRSLTGDVVVFTQDFTDTGVNLKVTPTVVDDIMIQLDINLDVSNVSRTRIEQGFQQPIVQTSTFSTHFDIKNGTSVLLGAVLRRVETTTETGIPYARDIPLLGRLFRGTEESLLNSELLIIVHPMIVNMEEGINLYIDPQADQEEVMGQIREQSKLLQKSETPLRQIYDLLLEGPSVE